MSLYEHLSTKDLSQFLECKKIVVKQIEEILDRRKILTPNEVLIAAQEKGFFSDQEQFMIDEYKKLYNEYHRNRP